MKRLILIANILFIAPLSQAQVWSTGPQPFGNTPYSQVKCLLTDTLNNLLYAGGSYPTAWYVTVYNGSTWDTLGTSFNDIIFCLALYNGELYAGGYFTANGSTPLSCIARWNGLSWQPAGAGLNNAPFSLAVSNGALYAGGLFTQAGGSPVSYIAKWDGTAWTSAGSGVNNVVWSLYGFNGKLYAGGSFTTAGGNTAQHIAEWDGASWLPLASGVSATVSCFTSYQGNLYAGGSFSGAGGLTVNGIAKWDGSQWSALGAGLVGGAADLSEYNGDLYASGSFTASGTIPLKGVGRWNGSGWSAPGTVPNGIKNCIASYGGNLCLGGNLLMNTATNYLVRWNNPPSVQPAAGFIVNDSLIEAGNYVKFTDQSTGSSLTYQWNFPGGNPSSSILQNPLVNYPSAGVYDVTLIVNNSAGTDTLEKTSYISVTNNPDTIGFGTSIEYAEFAYDNIYRTTITPTVTTEIDSCAYGVLEIYYYKPATYDPASSPILWGVHGLGGGGYSEIPDLQAIADRKHALIVAVSMVSQFDQSSIAEHSQIFNNSYYYTFFAFYQSVFKQLYRHILHRENRSLIPVHLIGFSEGGQFVTRYMLIRQAIPDSIPIRMAISSNPWFYTFCTDTFLTVPMPFPCGLMGGIWNAYVPASVFGCNEQVIQYYNENYAVLIGTADIAPGGSGCTGAQGANRYERAQNFYAFSDSNAITRGTSLQWQYVEIPGVAHSQGLMYNTKVNVTDSFTIAETLLFDTPYHTVPSLAPIANFYPDTTITLINGTINFTNTSINASSYLWDFGDDSTSTLINPFHTYTMEGTYTVRLTAFTGTGCSNLVAKKCYITVIDPNSINVINTNSFQIRITPNPFNERFKVSGFSFKEKEKAELTIYDLMGEKVFEKEFLSNQTEAELNLSFLQQGVYFLNLKTGKESYTRKIVKM